MRFLRPIPRGVLAAVAAVVVLAVVGVVVLAANIGSSSHPGQKVTAGTHAPLPAAKLKVAHLRHGKVAYGHKLHFTVTNAALQTVTIKNKGLGTVAGTFNTSRTRWTSTDPLPPSSQVTAEVSYVNLAHKTTTKNLAFTTKSVKSHFNALLSPGGGDTVGIASPVVVTFDQPIPESKRAAVEGGLSVTATPAVVGAWHWMSDQIVHYRPPTYWKTGTKVKITSNLQGVSIGGGVYGALGKHSTSFKIGASHISEVDQATHLMKVYDNGKLIKTFPNSTGRGQYPTMDGVHVTLSKQSVIEMNSATVGIPKGNPDYYDETVYWDVRISNGGEFVHAAPWSVGEQGRENVSHGCVNLSTENAEWFYNFAQTGDVVDIYNGVRPPENGDAGTADWNMSWKDWLKGDAAPSAAAKALHPLPPRDSEPGFTPKAKAHQKAVAQKAAKAAKAAKKKSTKKVA